MDEPPKFRHRLEYWAARALIGGLGLLPLNPASWLGARLGDVMRLVDRRHRERAESQAAERLGLDPAAAKAFAKRNFRSYGRTLAEFAHLPRMPGDAILAEIDLNGYDDFVAGLLAEGKGLVIITPHFGNWEWCHSLLKSLGHDGGSIARPLDNPLVNEYVRWIREKNGMRIFDKAGAIRKALGALRNKQVLGVLIDQDAGRSGLMSPFLGRPASTITIPVELAIRVGSPLATVGIRRRDGRGKRFIADFKPTAHYADPDADPQTEIRRLTDALNADLTDIIMRHPEQWLWIHRRWKSVGRN